MTIAVAVMMLAIMSVSLWTGSGGELKDDTHSQIAWTILLLGAVIAELYLIIFRDHTLSNQMQFWIHGEYKITGLIMFAFWVWLTMHFVVTPIVTVARRWLG